MNARVGHEARLCIKIQWVICHGHNRNHPSLYLQTAQLHESDPTVWLSSSAVVAKLPRLRPTWLANRTRFACGVAAVRCSRCWAGRT
jgi:hypothetical protein